MISAITSIIGIIFFFCGYPIVTIVCAVISLVSSVVNVVKGEQHGFITEIITIIIGLIIALIANIDIINGIAVAICIGDAGLTVFGLLFRLLSDR